MWTKLAGPLHCTATPGSNSRYPLDIITGGRWIRNFIQFQIKVVNKSRGFQLGLELEHGPDGDVWTSYATLRTLTDVPDAPTLIVLNADLQKEGPIGDFIKTVVVTGAAKGPHFADLEIWIHAIESMDGYLYWWRKQQLRWQEMLSSPGGPDNSWPAPSAQWPGPVSIIR